MAKRALIYVKIPVSRGKGRKTGFKWVSRDVLRAVQPKVRNLAVLTYPQHNSPCTGFLTALGGYIMITGKTHYRTVKLNKRYIGYTYYEPGHKSWGYVTGDLKSQGGIDTQKQATQMLRDAHRSYGT